MESLALAIGYIIMSFVCVILVYAFYKWALYGSMSFSISQHIKDNKIYVNDTFIKVKEGNISMINGSVYENGVCIYKHKNKFRWEK